jgi:hypothetical protein
MKRVRKATKAKKKVDPVVAEWLKETWTDAEIRRAVKAVEKSSGRKLKVF